MAERRATNKYYPPDWDPSKGSINTFVGQHPLRDRARKLDQGILIIRFEMPFSIWCEGCENHIGKGVRYNAEKKKVGMYYSTPIWQFRMKCHLCSSWMEIQTDPKNAVYVIISGARKREEEYDPEDNETMALKDKEEAEKLLDPMYKLEHASRDVMKAKEASSAVSNLLEYNDRVWKDPFTVSQKIRQKFRAEKRVRDAEAKDAREVRDKHNLLLNVLPLTTEDEIISKTIEYGVRASSKNMLRDSILSKSIFSARSPSSSSSFSRSNAAKTASLTSRPNKQTDSSQEAGLAGAVGDVGLRSALVTATRIECDPFAQTSFAGIGGSAGIKRPAKGSSQGRLGRKSPKTEGVNPILGVCQYSSSESE